MSGTYSKTILSWIIGLILGGLACYALAQDVPPPGDLPAPGEEPAPVVEPAADVPALVAKDAEGKPLPMTLAAYDVDVKVQSFAAEVAVTMTFRNETDRELAGNLYFPLPEGVTIDGYALDIAGQMIDGVAVTKERARVVYETVVRQGIDPGLVEWSGGNSFKTRVFPIPAKGTRTIRVKYVTMLETQAETGLKQWRLPLKFASAVENFKLRLEVIKPVAAPEVVAGALQDLTFAPWRESFVAETEQKNFLPGADLTIVLPKGNKMGELPPDVLVSPHSGMIVGKLRADERIYFAVRAECEKPVPPRAVILNGTFEMTTPEILTVFWDASGSRAAIDHEKEFAFLEAYLQSRFTTTVDIDLVVIRNTADAPQRFRIDMKKDERQPQIDAFIAALKEIAYDGATSLGEVKLPESAAAAQKEGSLASAMLFTDGISNFAQLKPEKLPCELHVFAVGTQIDTPRLNELAILNGGRYFNLDKVAANEAAQQLGVKTLRLSKIEGTGIILDETYPKLTPAVTGPIMVAGRMAAPTAELVLTFSLGDEVHSVQKYELKAAPDNSALAERLYAQTKLAELVIFPEEHRDAIESLGKEFGLVTPETSLLVLDSIDQYVQYEICPPASLPEMRDEYLRRMDTVEQQQIAQRENKIEHVLGMWNARVAWWNQEFKYPKDFKFAGDETTVRRSARVNSSGAVPLASEEEAPALNYATDGPMPGAVRGEGGGGEADFDALVDLVGATVEESIPVAYDTDVALGDDEEMDMGRVAAYGGRAIAAGEAAPATPAPATEQLPTFSHVIHTAPAAAPAPARELQVGQPGNTLNAPAVPMEESGRAYPVDALNQRVVPQGEAVYALTLEDGRGQARQEVRDSNGSERERSSDEWRRWPEQRLAQPDISEEVAAGDTIILGGVRRLDESASAENGETVGDPATMNASPPADAPVMMSGRLEAVAKESKVAEQQRERVYLKAMQEAGAEKAYATYLTFRKEFATNPQFFLECSLLLEKLGQHEMAVRVVSNLAELELENVPMLRILGRRLMQMNEPELAVTVFRRVQPMRAEEPHSFRDLALALIRTTEGKDAAQDEVKQALTEALGLLNDVVMKFWDGRFSEIEVTALEEANVLVIPRLQAAGVTEFVVDERLIKKMDLDFRIVMEWDADSTDIDLWVTEPSGEKVFYSHSRSTIGGLISRDFTQGYGPEEYLIKSAMPGKYLIQAHFYGSRSVELFGSVTIQAEVYTDWGRPTQSRKCLTFQLDSGNEVFTIGEVEK